MKGSTRPLHDATFRAIVSQEHWGGTVRFGFATAGGSKQPMRFVVLCVGTIAAATPIASRDAAGEALDRASAVGPVRCAMERGGELDDCAADVERGDGGAVRVSVTFPNGFARTLLFEAGAFVRANPTMSGVGTDTDWRVEDGVHVIRVEDQSYEVPSALIADE